MALDMIKLAFVKRCKRGSSGIGLLEVLITLVITGILATIALPSFQNILITARISAATSELHAAILLARSEAIKRGGKVTLCRSSNGDSDDPNCSTVNSNPVSNSGWGEGWLIFFDKNMNRKYDGGDTLIRAQGRLFKSASQGAIMPSPMRNQINFTATGQTFGTFLRFTISRPDGDNDSTHDRYICIASGGRARVDNGLCTGQ